MKKNFYLQHPLMAMYDPRMQQLTEKEGLRGLGAYWVIIEKLGMLPEPRARQEYLRPHCDGKKITLAYLLKIIREYGLFELEEDGYFTPKELNPPRKNDEKTAKKGEAEPYSKAKNDEKRQKTPRENAEKQLPKTSNTLENSKLPKTAEKNNKENINNYIKTTAASATEEETAAAADRSLRPSDAGGVPPATSGGAQTACDGNGDDDGNGGNNGDQSQSPGHPVRPWREMADDLVRESSWLDIACMKSGYGCLLKRHIREAVKIFKQHVEAYGKGGNLLDMSDVQGYFVNYVSAGSRTSRTLHEALCTLDTHRQAAAPPDPHRYEQLVDGKRTYLGCPIPDDAPPRPDNNAFWNETTRSWTSPQQPPSQKRPKQQPG